jgi:hypothetical protein
LFPKPKFRLAFAFALGAFFSAVISTIFWAEQNQTKSDRIMGTIGLRPKTEFKTIEQADMDLPAVKGSATLKQSEDDLILDVWIRPSAECELVLKFEEPAIHFQSIAPQKQSRFMIENLKNRIRIRQNEEARYALSLVNRSLTQTSIHLGLSISGDEVYQKEYILKSKK